MFRPKVVSVAALLALCLPSVGLTATIHVPADQPTIQAGIDAALAGDTVLVADGIYTGEGNRDIDFGGKGIVLKSENGPEVTVIDCEGSYSTLHRGFYFHSGEDSSAVVDGFTVQDGHHYNGGGIYCGYSSNPTIINNTINDNSTDSNGGGVSCSDSDPTISNNSIRGNSADHWGGGIACSNSDPTIVNNIISGNSAVWSGGIDCDHSSPTILNNTISENSADYWGGGISCVRSNPAIVNNTINNNSADYRGGGIACRYSNPSISNNTIIRNSAYWGGGGIYCDSSSPVIGNTILAFSTSSSGAISCNVGSNPSLTCCDVYGNEGGDWVGCIGGQEGRNGNFSADPNFCYMAGGDFHLSSYSPCAAENNACGELIGALGVTACDSLLCGDADGDGRLTLGDLELVRAFYFEEGDWPTPLAAGDANCSGLVNIGDIIYLADYLFRDGDDPCCP